MSIAEGRNAYRQMIDGAVEDAKARAHNWRTELCIAY